MKRGFTIIELLVASMLLGMLLTVLTMLFNQSSISWRTGVAGVADLDEVRDNIAEVREEADNAYIWDNEVHARLGRRHGGRQLRQPRQLPQGARRQPEQQREAQGLQDHRRRQRRRGRRHQDLHRQRQECGTRPRIRHLGRYLEFPR